jgi:hypothetical protein
MNTDTIDILNKLPLDKQEEVNDFIAFLLQKYQAPAGSGNSSDEAILKNRMQIAGRMKGKIWMADDFNDTPEDFKDYI